MKYTNLTHADMDGAGCSIVLLNINPDINIVMTGRKSFEKNLDKVSNDDSDIVLITDLLLSTEELLKFKHKKKVYYIDHHEQKADFSKLPENFKIITDISISASQITYNTFKDKITNKNIKKLIRYINDYDMWEHNFKQSFHLNSLYWYIGAFDFIKKFKDWDGKFSKVDVDIMKRLYNEIKEEIDKNEKIELDDDTIIVFSETQSSNVTLFVKGYKLYFILYGNRISIRSTEKGFDTVKLSEYIKKKHEGVTLGGHKKAFGLTYPKSYSDEEVFNIIDDIYSYYKENML